jgi:hypothetical protein
MPQGLRWVGLRLCRAGKLRPDALLKKALFQRCFRQLIGLGANIAMERTSEPLSFPRLAVLLQRRQGVHNADRLDWNGLSVAFTDDGRPNSLTERYAEGCDLLITEVQPELMAISSGVNGVLPVMGQITVDTSQNPGYAAGYLFNQVKPRLAMTTHMSYDAYSNLELLAQIREHWKGPFQFGAPDMIVVNMTSDQIWVREGVTG